MIKATFTSADSDYEDTSSSLDQVVGEDTAVNATGLSTSATSIFPYHDGYRDTIVVRGTRNENVSVSITVTNSARHLVARGTILAGMGAYSWTWTGKTSSGTMLAAGSYVIKQVLRDQSGNTLTWSKTVALSAKRLYTHTFSKTLNGNQFQFFGKSPSTAASVAKRSSPYANEVRIHATSSVWAAVEYYVTLPSASVSKSLRFYATAKSSGNVLFAAWNPSWGGYLNTNAYDVGRFLGSSYGTYAFSAPPSTHISAHHVHAMVFTGYPWGAGTSDIAKIKVVFVYAVLK